MIGNEQHIRAPSRRRRYDSPGAAGSIALLRLSLLAGAIFVVAPAAASAQEFIVNGGFETGANPAAPPWLFTNGANAITAAPAAHTGNRFLILACDFIGGCGSSGPFSGTASQTATLSQSGKYAFSFWYSFSANGGPATYSLSAMAGGNTAFNANVSGSGSGLYTQVSTTVTLSKGANAVQLSGAYVSGSNISDLLIDDVSLTFLQALSLVSQLQPGGDIIAFLGLVVRFECRQASDDIRREQGAYDFETGKIEPGGTTGRAGNLG
jgi:hypothetical protein